MNISMQEPDSLHNAHGRRWTKEDAYMKSRGKKPAALKKPQPSRMLHDRAPGFNIDEWVQVHALRSRIAGSDEGLVKYHTTITMKKPHMLISFGESILEHLSLGKEMRAMVMQHREDRNRLVIFASPNGYKVNRPSKQNHRCYIRISNREGKWPACSSPLFIEPILHPKGMSSSTVVEIVVKGDS